jgi:ketosteroid isomerase-like protein
MMGAPENKQLMQDVFAELSNGNSKPFLESLADDVQWTIVGTTSWSRTFQGKERVLAELLTPLRTRLVDRVRVTAHRFIAEGDHVVVEARGQSTTKAGRPYNNTYCWIYRFANGKVQELTEYLDTQLVEAALGELV